MLLDGHKGTKIRSATSPRGPEVAYRAGGIVRQHLLGCQGRGGGSPGPSTGFEVIAPGRQDIRAKREPNPACRSANLLWAHTPRLLPATSNHALSRFFRMSRGSRVQGCCKTARYKKFQQLLARTDGNGLPLRQAKLGKGGSDVGNIMETFRRNPAGNQSRSVEFGQQREASLASSVAMQRAKRRQRVLRPCY